MIRPTRHGEENFMPDNIDFLLTLFAAVFVCAVLVALFVLLLRLCTKRHAIKLIIEGKLDQFTDDDHDEFRAWTSGSFILTKRNTMRKMLDSLINNHSPLAIRLLAEIAALSYDEKIQSLALIQLGDISNQNEIDVVCGVWAESRSKRLEALIIKHEWIASEPSDVRLLTLVRFKDIEESALRADRIVVVAKLCTDDDHIIADLAVSILSNLQKHENIDSLCLIWFDRRELHLEKILLKAGYIATQPLEVRVYSALKNGKREMISLTEQNLSDVVRILNHAKTDPDRTISRTAVEVLEELHITRTL